jgi:hypothetical protein
MSVIELWKKDYLHSINNCSRMNDKWQKFRKMNLEKARNEVTEITERINRRPSMKVTNRVIQEYT